MHHISIQVLAQHQDFIEKVRTAFPDAVIADVDRITGKQLMITVILPITLAAAQIVAPYVVMQQPAGRKKVVIAGDVIYAENLSKEELEAALAAYVVSQQAQPAREVIPAKKAPAGKAHANKASSMPVKRP